MAENNLKSAWHLVDNPDIIDVQRENHFTFIVTNLDGLVNIGNGTIFKNPQETLEIAVTSSSVPMFKQDIIQIKRGNTTIKLAGNPTFDDNKIVLDDFIGADAKSALLSWQALSFNSGSEKIGSMRDYKKTCYLVEYTPDGRQVRTWKLYGCWISGLDTNDFNHESSGKKTINAVITYDKAIMELPEEE